MMCQDSIAGQWHFRANFNNLHAPPRSCPMHIRFIKPAETHALRQQVLRPGQPLEEMEWSKDRASGNFHLGVQEEEDLIAIASFFRERNEFLRGWIQYRLRGMATAPRHQGKGFGTRLLQFGMGHLRDMKADLLWCNARENAVGFYARAGFKGEGQTFLIEGIGIHHLMYHRL
jgi:GNAT superfamily N-acetyltransferase